MSDLNERQQLAVALLSTGTRNKDVAEQLGISVITLSVWVNQPAFKYALALKRREAIDAVEARLLSIADRALNTLVEILDDPTAPAPARVSAARVILGRVLDARPPTPEPVPPVRETTDDEVWDLIRQVREGKTAPGKQAMLTR
jgi:transposase-like protein